DPGMKADAAEEPAVAGREHTEHEGSTKIELTPEPTQRLDPLVEAARFLDRPRDEAQMLDALEHGFVQRARVVGLPAAHDQPGGLDPVGRSAALCSAELRCRRPVAHLPVRRFCMMAR